MIKVPETKEEAIGFIGNLLWWAGRLRLIGIAIGVVGTITLQLLTGFWDFRSEHQVIVRAKYEQALEAHSIFQSQIERFNSVFDGHQGIESDVGTYGDIAQTYIQEISEVTELLPGTKDEIADYIEAISELNQYYTVIDAPEINSLDWVLFYGKFRTDFDRYIKTRDAYLEELASEVGSYWRAVRNS